MSEFRLCGRLVQHLGEPRFTVLFTPTADGGWDGRRIDPPTGNAGLSASRWAALMNEAAEFFRVNHRSDWLQEAVSARAAALSMTAYSIAKATGNAVSEDHVRDYLCARKSMGSHKLQHVLNVLGMKIGY